MNTQPADCLDLNDFSLELLAVARLYSELEARINGAVAAACQPVCRLCRECCCAVRFCRESVDSYWLGIIAAVSGQDVGAFDEGRGWLSSQGCRLKVGRPPVCYEFFCEAIVTAEVNPAVVYALKVLGRLPGFVGARALGGRHLVTLSRFELSRVPIAKIRQRVAIAEAIFTDCQEIIRAGHGRVDRLSRVMKPPKVNA
ncbi:hypothetical protein KI809_16440 [Geobacter pelophilus]|uniref:Uncharacterized protein n=1 Tax=Geoanaerobacter pelophilus TaxID=60036 RepID=A0AAW4L8L3_9BACT|nr:hypothetical protein [Geoanaerobacter pelophilus]MBT0665900.1 hypothetical protein [Geoanaerobacter pelophilus]